MIRLKAYGEGIRHVDVDTDTGAVTLTYFTGTRTTATETFTFDELRAYEATAFKLEVMERGGDIACELSLPE